MTPARLVVTGLTKLASLLILTLLGSMFCLPLTCFAGQDSPEVNELKQRAQSAFIEGHYAEAAAMDLEIAEKYPGNQQARRYAVQMLGTLYENNVVDIKKAIKWDREFLKEYANPKQVSFYQEKIASLEKLLNQEQAFKIYQEIRFARQSDEVMVKRFEALLKEHPDFLLKDKVERELAYAYARLDKRRQSDQAFQALSQSEGKKLSSSDQLAYATANRYWQMTSVWGWSAWGVIAILWAAVLLMKPWKRLTRTSIRNFVVLAAIWVLLAAASMPHFYSINTDADDYVLHDKLVCIAAGLNLIILVWLLLLTRGEFWQSRRRALRWLAPVLTLLMTTAVFYLLIIHQAKGPEIIDVFADRYADWAEDLHIAK